MNKCYLGIDTSNYTTSICVYDATSNKVFSKRNLLNVKPGNLGLRQSEAVFQHTKNLPSLVEDVFLEYVGELTAVGSTNKPREKEDSYMPCFLVGSGLGKSLSTINKIPSYNFTHQQGHICAALFSAKKMELINKKFIALHISGGTTDILLCDSNKSFLHCEEIATSLDLHAGQLIDRIGLMLKCNFPCGKELEKLALLCDEDVEVHSVIKGYNCCLSGFENQAQKLLEKGYSREYVAKFAIMAVAESILDMLKPILKEYGKLPLVFTGGVMSNSIIKKFIFSSLYHEIYFSTPECATDNAIGIAVLTAIKDLLNGNTENFNSISNI